MEWSPLRTHSSSLQQSGAPRAGGHTLTITFQRHWNISLPLRCLVPFGICVYFQSSCHLVATCSTNQLCWKRTSLTSCIINYFAGCASSVLWEIIKFIKVIRCSTSPCWTLYYRPLLFPSIIYFCLFNLSSYRSYPSPLIIPIPLSSIISRSVLLFLKEGDQLVCGTYKMQAQHVYLVYKNLYQQFLFPMWDLPFLTFNWCAHVTPHSDSKWLVVGSDKLFTNHHYMWHLSAWSPICCFIMLIVLQDASVIPQEVVKPTTLTNLVKTIIFQWFYVFQTCGTKHCRHQSSDALQSIALDKECSMQSDQECYIIF